MMRRGLLTISLVLVAMWLVAPVAVLAHPHGAEPILFGIAPQQEPEKVREMWKPFFRYLEQEVGYRFAFETASSIEEFQQRVLEGRYDIWWGNPLTYVQAEQAARLRGRSHAIPRGSPGCSSRSRRATEVAQGAGRQEDRLLGTRRDRRHLARAKPTSPVSASRRTRSRPCTRALTRRPIGQSSTAKAMAAGGVPRSFNALEPAQREKLVVLAKTEEGRASAVRGASAALPDLRIKIQRALLKLSTGLRRARTFSRPFSTRRSLCRTISTTMSTATSRERLKIPY